MAKQNISNLDDLLARMRQAARGGGEVSLDDVLEVVGRRSFGPLLLVPGIVTVSPLVGDIPGVPVLMGIFIIIVAVQVLMRRRSFWLPGWLLNRSVKAATLRKAATRLRKPARFIDRFLKPRIAWLTGGAATHFMAVCCILIALATPAMEFVPTSANWAGLAIIFFGLSLIANDGLLALAAFLFTMVLFGGGLSYWLLS
jgi:hypothetical protein